MMIRRISGQNSSKVNRICGLTLIPVSRAYRFKILFNDGTIFAGNTALLEQILRRRLCLSSNRPVLKLRACPSAGSQVFRLYVLVDNTVELLLLKLYL